MYGPISMQGEINGNAGFGVKNSPVPAKMASIMDTLLYRKLDPANQIYLGMGDEGPMGGVERYQEPRALTSLFAHSPTRQFDEAAGHVMGMEAAGVLQDPKRPKGLTDDQARVALMQASLIQRYPKQLRWGQEAAPKQASDDRDVFEMLGDLFEAYMGPEPPLQGTQLMAKLSRVSAAGEGNIPYIIRPHSEGGMEALKLQRYMLTGSRVDSKLPPRYPAGDNGVRTTTSAK